jgi:hypothetical protein
MLDRIADPSPDRWTGLTNIFFAPVPDSLRRVAHLDDGWTAVEVADVVAGDGFKPIYAARFKTSGSEEFHYVLDTAGMLDFTRGRQLTFRRSSGVRVADVELDVRSRSGAHQRVPYQVLLSDDGYTYARLAEYRTGRLRVDGRDHPLKVRAASRNTPFYGLGPGTVFLVDLDGDGQIAEQAVVTAGGRPAAAEEVTPGAPFLVGGRAFEFSAIDSAGTRLVVRPSRTRIAAVEGFEAPDLAGEVLTGGRYRLSQHSSGITLIEFWSTDCVFTERVRPAANALAAAMRGTPYTWAAVVRESDRTAIARHLAEHPMTADVVLTDSATWAAYNPTGVTPLFVVVDAHGTVRYRAMGASAMDAVAAKVRALLGAPPP